MTDELRNRILHLLDQEFPEDDGTGDIIEDLGLALRLREERGALEARAYVTQVIERVCSEGQISAHEVDLAERVRTALHGCQDARAAL